MRKKTGREKERLKDRKRNKQTGEELDKDTSSHTRKGGRER
jgi:hypothetical protein